MNQIIVITISICIFILILKTRKNKKRNADYIKAAKKWESIVDELSNRN